MTASEPLAAPVRSRLLIVDDDPIFAGVLARAMNSRGFEVIRAEQADQALRLNRQHLPDYGILDLKLGSENGLKLIPGLHAQNPTMRILLLTGYASIATAVEAIKRGAHDYLTKPVDADSVVRALLDNDQAEGTENDAVDTPEAPLALRRLEWEHIQRVLTECDGNISATARRLGMHRRTLQRKLGKHPVHERPAQDS